MTVQVLQVLMKTYICKIRGRGKKKKKNLKNTTTSGTVHEIVD